MELKSNSIFDGKEVNRLISDKGTILRLKTGKRNGKEQEKNRKKELGGKR